MGLRRARQQSSGPLSLGPYRAALTSQARHLGSSLAGVGGLRVEGRTAGSCLTLTPALRTSLRGKHLLASRAVRILVLLVHLHSLDTAAPCTLGDCVARHLCARDADAFQVILKLSSSRIWLHGRSTYSTNRVRGLRVSTANATYTSTTHAPATEPPKVQRASTTYCSAVRTATCAAIAMQLVECI